MSWMDKAAKEIETSCSEPRPDGSFTPGYIHSVIAKHLPRCVTCMHWKRLKNAMLEPPITSGQCTVPPQWANTSCTREDFGCVQWKERV